jgi:hypothetical protein
MPNVFREQGSRRELRVGGHTVHVFFDARATEVTLSNGPPRYKEAPDYGCLIGIAVVTVILIVAWLINSN